MNELSIAEMGNKLGIDGVLTQQSINLIVDYGLNLIAGIVTLAIGIGLFTTVIDTFDNVYISIPNSSIWTSKITNHARYGTRRLDLDIGIGYDSSLDAAETALLSLANDDRVLAEPAPQFLVVGYGDSAINVRLRAFAKYDDFFGLYWDLNRKLKDVLDLHNIQIPFPQRVIHHTTTPPDDE